MTIQEIAALCVVTDNMIVPPAPDEVHIPRESYVNFKEVMENNLGKWKGGKTAAFIFDYDPTDLLVDLAAGKDINLKKKFQFFPTDAAIVDRMLQHVIPWHGMRILEPSAGQGHIIEAIRDFCPSMWNDIHVDTIELNPINRAILTQKGFAPIHDDFLTFEPTELYDAVIANPPFDRSGWIDHVYKMHSCLKDDGEMVSVVPKGVSFRNDKKHKAFREFVERHEGGIYELEAGSFKSSGTMVSTCLVHMYKAETQAEVMEEQKITQKQSNQISLW